jgi:hypothetical protein
MESLPEEHGTVRGYNQHVNRKTKKCTPCKDAHNAYLRKYRARTGRAQTVRVSHETVALLALYAPRDIAEKLVDEIGEGVYATIAAAHTPELVTI